MIFQVLLFVLIFACYIMSRRYENSKKVFLVSLGIAVVALFGSRYFKNSYTDEVTYNYLYQGFINTNWSTFYAQYKDVRDFGFYLFYWLMSQIVPWSQFPIYFITGITILSFFRFFYKYSDDELISVLLLFCFGSFSFYMAAYRQTFAMCLCIFALDFAIRKKTVPYIVLILFAFTMHRSALVFAPVIFFLMISRSKNANYLRILVVAVVWIVARFYMIDTGSDLAEKDISYSYDFSLLGFAIQSIIMAAPFILNIFKKNIPRKNDSIVFGIDTLLLIGLALYLTKLVYYAFERISYYYTFAVMISFPSSVERLEDDEVSKKLVKLVTYILLIGLYAYRALGTRMRFFWSVG